MCRFKAKPKNNSSLLQTYNVLNGLGEFVEQNFNRVSQNSPTMEYFMSKHILILAGDGIGPEIVKAAEQVLTRVNDQFNLGLTWEQGLLGGAAIDAHGSPYPDVTAAQAKMQMQFLLVR